MINVNCPLVSVILPVFNASNFIRETIQSVLDQTWTNFELIIVDDGSTDSSVNIVQSFLDPRITCIELPENLGVVAARNAGVTRACGEYIAFLDADDVAHKTRIETQIAIFAENTSLGLLGTWIDYIDQNGTPLASEVEFEYSSIGWKTALLFRNPFTFSTIMVRKVAIPTPAFRVEFQFCEDYDFIARVGCAWELSKVPTPLVSYRIHANNMSASKGEKMRSLDCTIQRFLLKSVGLDPSPADLLFHHDIGKKQLVKDQESLERSIEWLRRLFSETSLVERNQTSEITPVISDVWFEFCQQQSYYGLFVWFQYLKLIRTLRLQTSTSRIAKLFVKCLWAAACQTLQVNRNLTKK